MRNEPSQPPADILRLITKNLTEMVLAYDMDRKLVFVNPAVESLTGYSVDEIEKANFICWIHPDDQPRMLSFWDLLFQGKSFHEEEYRMVAKDGRVKWVVASWIPIRDDSGRQVGVQGREFDITLRKLSETSQHHSEEKLRADEARYRTLFERSPFPMWEEDFSDVKAYLDSLTTAGIADIRDHLARNRPAVEECLRRVRVLDVNQAAREFYSASSKEELLGSLDRIFDEPAFEVFREEMATLSENHSTFQTEFSAHTLRNEERRVEMIVSIVDSARHDWSRVIVSFFDVTDRKRLEEQFIQSQKMESLGRLAGGIAHDFNNLLTVINGYTDWMLQDMGPVNPYRIELQEVRSAGEQCAKLTQQLLAFSRNQVVRSGPLDLNRLVRESLNILDRILGDDISISTQLAADLAIVDADDGQMHQVLMNLVVNAREAMPAGGTLTIATRNAADPLLALLEVRDTGHGIDETTRRHLFEPFFTTKRGSRNTGMGLATVFGIVSNAGGRIEVDSQAGKGTAFRIYLPRSLKSAERTTGPEPHSLRADPRHGKAGPVLVVDDREEVRTLTCRMLKQLGYETITAASGAEALTIAQNHQGRIPLVLTDVVMPGMNGRELVDQLYQTYPHMKAIFMSGYSDRILNDSALDAPAIYLQKPFTLAQLSVVLEGLAGK